MHRGGMRDRVLGIRIIVVVNRVTIQVGSSAFLQSGKGASQQRMDGSLTYCPNTHKGVGFESVSSSRLGG